MNYVFFLTLGECTSFVLRLATKARSRALGPLHPSFDISRILRDVLDSILPDNAHEIVKGRLYVSLTRVSDRQPILVSEFHSKADLIQVRTCFTICLQSNLVENREVVILSGVSACARSIFGHRNLGYSKYTKITRLVCICKRGTLHMTCTWSSKKIEPRKILTRNIGACTKVMGLRNFQESIII